MTREARLMSGIILITVPTIQYGGYFLLTSLLNKSSGYMENPLRQNFFRAGHAHAGVIVILSLVCQILADAAVLPMPLIWFVRIGVPLAAILIGAAFGQPCDVDIAVRNSAFWRSGWKRRLFVSRKRRKCSA